MNYLDGLKTPKNILMEWEQEDNKKSNIIKKTKFSIIDNELLGLRPGQFLIVGGRPGTGKNNLSYQFNKQHRANIIRKRIYFIYLIRTVIEWNCRKVICSQYLWKIKNFYEIDKKEILNRNQTAQKT
ncbi:hypothetical protein NWQ33_00365 [Mycoplasmopsis cynos]|nr:hypothetical protein [Mycoplasmopsis cynos]